MGCPGFFVQRQTPGPVKFPRRGTARYGCVVIDCAAEALLSRILGHGSSAYCHDRGHDHAYCQRKTLAVHRSSSNLEVNLAESPGTAKRLNLDQASAQKPFGSGAVSALRQV